MEWKSYWEMVRIDSMIVSECWEISEVPEFGTITYQDVV